MKLYGGDRREDGTVYVWVQEEETTRSLRHVVLHSPTGFEWGYGGSGPADLALSILCDHFGYTGSRQPRPWPDDPFVRAWDLHQAFKWDHVSKWPSEGHWRIESGDIERWVEERRRAAIQ